MVAAESKNMVAQNQKLILEATQVIRVILDHIIMIEIYMKLSHDHIVMIIITVQGWWSAQSQDGDGDILGEGGIRDQALCEQLARGQEEVIERKIAEGKNVFFAMLHIYFELYLMLWTVMFGDVFVLQF